jgi:predicted MFS family arabinose efflux permease
MNLSSVSSSSNESTLCFWVGFILGSLAGIGLGALMGDMIGWAYMTGTTGCIASLAFDRPAKVSVPAAPRPAPQLATASIQ